MVIARTPGARQASRAGVPRGSRGGARDVVVGAVEGRVHAVEVEQQPGGARIAVARLPDAARVQKPFARGDVELGALALGLARGRLALAAAEGQRDMASGRSGRRAGSARPGTARRAAQRARTPRRGRAGSRGRGRSSTPPPWGLSVFRNSRFSGVDHLLGPLRGDARAAREILERQLAGHREVVVAREADRRVLARQLDAGVGLGAVADEVAEAPELGASLAATASSVASKACRLAWMSEMTATFIAFGSRWYGPGVLPGPRTLPLV